MGVYIYVRKYMCIYIYVYIHIFDGGVRHCGCKGLHPLGLTRAMRASLINQGFPQRLCNVVLNDSLCKTEVCSSLLKQL